MSATRFTELLAQAGKLDQKFIAVSSSTENEKVKTCEELVSALDRLLLTKKSGKQKITIYALYASTKIAWSSANPHQLIHRQKRRRPRIQSSNLRRRRAEKVQRPRRESVHESLQHRHHGPQHHPP